MARSISIEGSGDPYDVFSTGADMDGVNVVASAQALLDLIEDEVVAAYPDAEVTVRAGADLRGTIVLTDDGDTDEEVTERVNRIMGRVHADRQDEWIVLS